MIVFLNVFFSFMNYRTSPNEKNFSMICSPSCKNEVCASNQKSEIKKKRRSQRFSLVQELPLIEFLSWPNTFLIFVSRLILLERARYDIVFHSILDELFRLVVGKGGLVEVINKKLWREVTKGLNLPSSITSAAFTLRTQ